MRFSQYLTSILASASLIITSLPTISADADFESVRTRLEKDHSGKKGDPKEKYFHESIFHPHYDGRFAEKTMDYEERRPALVGMVQAYLSTMADLGAETWIMHGTLIGWWWNRKVLPWDSDIDVQVTLETMQFLRSYYNLGIFHFKNEELGVARDYMLEINPNFDVDNEFDHLNRIDARWIDTETGIFIDMTAVRPNMSARALGVEGALRCKDMHHYLEEDLFPLRDSVFEGTPCKVPYEYSWLLEEEYGRDVLTRTEIQSHKWNATNGEWEPAK